jgi:hypothetical protein
VLILWLSNLKRSPRKNVIQMTGQSHLNKWGKYKWICRAGFISVAIHCSCTGYNCNVVYIFGVLLWRDIKLCEYFTISDGSSFTCLVKLHCYTPYECCYIFDSAKCWCVYIRTLLFLSYVLWLCCFSPSLFL